MPKNISNAMDSTESGNLFNIDSLKSFEMFWNTEK